MIVPHRLPPHKFAVPPRILSLSEAVVLGFQAFEKSFHGFGESFVSGNLRHPGCIATTCWDAEERQEGQPRWLAFVRYVGVVADCAQFGRVSLSTMKVVASQIDVVVLKVTFDMGSGWLQ
jgi:hypothetical protein